MTQEYILHNDITQEHRARMLNLKKYYPFFCLIQTNFDTFRGGQYASLDMGYIVMAVLRFFIEENNFKEKEVTYPEYVDFVSGCVRRDFGLSVTDSEAKDIADFVFDKMKNDGKPFAFQYYDPVDRKHRVSRMKLIESTIRNNTVWYSISTDAVEFYLDTKEIKEESRISIQQLLLEKMIRAQDFQGGTQVVARINSEVERLMLRKASVEQLLATDIFAGFDAYQEFVATGMQWFDDEQKLFAKNMELIEAALAKTEHVSQGDGYLKAADEIYELDHQLKVAMSRHSELLRACMDMQKMTDDLIRSNKLSRLRNHCDYKRLLEQMRKSDSIALLEWMVQSMLKPNAGKHFSFFALDDIFSVRGEYREQEESIPQEEAQDIIFEDELEEERIRQNYDFFMKNILRYAGQTRKFTLSDFIDYLKDVYGEQADRILRNADYYSFLANLCQKKEYQDEERKLKIVMEADSGITVEAFPGTELSEIHFEVEQVEKSF